MLHTVTVAIQYREPDDFDAASLLAAYQAVVVIGAPPGVPVQVGTGDPVADWWTVMGTLRAHRQASEFQVRYSLTVSDFLRDANGLYVWAEDQGGIVVNAVRVAAA